MDCVPHCKQHLGFASLATISYLDVSLFTTDFQAIWPHQSPLPPASATQQSQNSFQEDFELFASLPVTRSTAPPHTHAQETSNTARSPAKFPLRARRPSLNNSYKSTGYTSSPSNWSNPTFEGQVSQRAASNHGFPSALRQPRTAKPPVPLFESNPESSVGLRVSGMPPQLPQEAAFSGQGDFTKAPNLHRFGLKPDCSDMDLQNDLDLDLTTDGGILGPDAQILADSSLHLNVSLAPPPSYVPTKKSNDGTVSPQDVINDSSVMSAPSSTAFPNLSTPGSTYLESPYLGNSSLDSLDTSPMYGDSTFERDIELAEYSSLFPNASDSTSKTPMRIGAPVASASPTQPGASPMSRQSTSGGAVSCMPQVVRKHSTTSGVRPLKQHKPLPEIVIDPNRDTREDLKRKKNTAAARKSRQRKLETSEALQTENDRLTEEVERLRQIVQSLGGSPDM